MDSWYVWQTLLEFILHVVSTLSTKSVKMPPSMSCQCRVADGAEQRSTVPSTYDLKYQKFGARQRRPDYAPSPSVSMIPREQKP